MHPVLTTGLAQLPFQVLFPVIVVGISYYMVGLQPALGRFLIACMASVLSAVNGKVHGASATFVGRGPFGGSGIRRPVGGTDCASADPDANHAL